jgi:DNA-binding HxlR family transcriptional regulator
MVSSPDQAQALRDLLDRRWSLAVLAELHRTKGARFVPLGHRVGAARQSLRRTLDGLIEAGFVMPNPGYGHPSRPEYVLTDRGARIAPAAEAVLRALENTGLQGAGLHRWSLPVLTALGRDRRFSELKAALPNVTSRALAGALKELTDAGLVERTVHDSFPPHASYRSTTRGRRIVGNATRLAASLADS